jgi:hypothetical protein
LTGSGCREHSYGGFGGGHPHFLPYASDLLIRRSGQLVQDCPLPLCVLGTYSILVGTQQLLFGVLAAGLAAVA